MFKIEEKHGASLTRHCDYFDIMQKGGHPKAARRALFENKPGTPEFASLLFLLQLSLR